MASFTAISNNFTLAARQLGGWFRRSNALLKLISLPWIALAYTSLRLIAWLFMLGYLFDVAGAWLHARRNGVLNLLRNAASQLRYRKSAYFQAPIIGAFALPFGILLGLTPKMAMVEGTPNNDPLAHVSVKHGFFLALSRAYWGIGWNALTCLFGHGFWFFPIAALISLYLVPAALAVSLFFGLFLLLDLVGWVLDSIKEAILTTSEWLAERTGNNLVTVVTLPLVLVAMMPLYLGILLSGSLDIQGGGGA